MQWWLYRKAQTEDHQLAPVSEFISHSFCPTTYPTGRISLENLKKVATEFGEACSGESIWP